MSCVVKNLLTEEREKKLNSWLLETVAWLNPISWMYTYSEMIIREVAKTTGILRRALMVTCAHHFKTQRRKKHQDLVSKTGMVDGCVYIFWVGDT